jgi:flagellar export protein FliJ
VPFKFSLQAVLDLRRRVEELRQREMQEISKQVEYVESLIRQARNRQMMYHDELMAKSRKGMAFAEREIYTNYLLGVEALVTRSEEHLEILRKELNRRKERLVAAARDRQVLEELEKEERKQYELQERRAEAKRFDEIAIRNFLIAQREKSAESEE